MTWDIRLIEKSGPFHIHHEGTKDEARVRARRMAERHWPKEDGYRHRWNADCVLVFRDGKHVGDCAVEPLEHPAE